MLGVATATLVGRALSRETIYSLKLYRRGIRLHARAPDVLSQMRVRDVMSTDVQTVLADMSVESLIELMTRRHLLGFPVVDAEGRYIGMVRISNIEEEVLENGQDRTVADIVERVPTVFPDQTLEEALQHFGPTEQRRIPVVKRDNPDVLVGMLYAWDVVNAYRQVRSMHQAV